MTCRNSNLNRLKVTRSTPVHSKYLSQWHVIFQTFKTVPMHFIHPDELKCVDRRVFNIPLKESIFNGLECLRIQFYPLEDPHFQSAPLIPNI